MPLRGALLDGAFGHCPSRVGFVPHPLLQDYKTKNVSLLYCPHDPTDSIDHTDHTDHTDSSLEDTATL
jgi:hypothetical protein